jgi:hypothetical protein
MAKYLTTRVVDLAMNGVSQDVRFGLRALWNRPGFALLVMLTLALGVGATTGSNRNGSGRSSPR